MHSKSFKCISIFKSDHYEIIFKCSEIYQVIFAEIIDKTDTLLYIMAKIGISH